MKTTDLNPKLAKRQLLLRDGLIVLVLFSIAIALFGVTSFLFRSFQRHRDVLAKEWSERGQSELQRGRPLEAVSSLRAALSYAPDDDAYQSLLARALADEGRTEEAINYFLNIWVSSPGDGFVNLQLARLMRRKGDVQSAIEYYHASIFGTWQDDGAVRRREVRLELADYLIERHDLSAARAELLIAAGDAPENAHMDLTLGDRFQSADDLTDALIYYQKAIADDPQDRTALENGGRVAYALGDYSTANKLLMRALQKFKPTTNSKSQQEDLTSMAESAERLLALTLSQDLPPNERTEHILFASKVAKARLKSCFLQFNSAAGIPPSLQDIKARWKAANGVANRRTLMENSESRDNMARLIYDTELQTRQLCGPPTGDDALLLLLANSPDGSRHQQD
jgi:tetratricopeptide (TPR) repeat protein